MATVPKHSERLFGEGSADADLSREDLRQIVEESLAEIGEGAKVLAVLPDKTRDDSTDVLVPFAVEYLRSKNIAKFDVLIAQGTHSRMSPEEKRVKIGIGNGVEIPGLGRVFDHEWNDPAELAAVGVLSEEKVAELTGGLYTQRIPLKINRLLAAGNYDYVLIFGATVPHEVAGFAGGAKYFFPGVAGPELTHATHWLGALAGIENTIGRIETPTRRLIEAAGDFVPARVICFTSVVSRTQENHLQNHALFAGNFRDSLRAGAEISRQVHIKYTGRKYRRVVALLDEHYDELWVGGKASYKLGPVIEDGGELIIFAPGLRCLSDTHGETIEKFGYAPIEKIRELVAASGELGANLCVAAHLAHVAFAGRIDEKGEAVPRYRITLCSQVDEQTCRRVNLRFMALNEFDLNNFTGNPDTLIVERAGRDLYLVEPLDAF